MYVVGYPKSGNTWLCYLLAYCLNSKYDDMDDPGTHPRNEYQRKHVKGGLKHVSYESELGPVLKTHRLRIANQDDSPVIYLVRDGRDVMVSYFFYINAFTKKKRLALKKHFWEVASHKFGVSKIETSLKRSGFHRFLRQHASEWANHVNTWIARNPTAVVRYEDLHTVPKETLDSLMMRLNAQVLSDIILKAVEMFNFQRLTGRQSGEEDRKSFFRKGIVGDWKNHFSKRDLDCFQHEAGDTLEMLGYQIQRK